MKKATLKFGAIAGLLMSSSAHADVKVQFIEGAPKDRFVITNVGECDWGARQLKIDFSASNGGLIFDVTGSGAGVEVFQPFEVTSGAGRLLEEPKVSDGDQIVSLDMSGLGLGETIEFTTDVDDTNGTREITVTNGEIDGTTVSVFIDGKTYSAKMDAYAEVLINASNCDA
ncbi:MAG: aggregation factor core [Paracoccaceae bacterium]